MEINIRTLRDIVNSFRLTQEQREYLVKSIMAGSNEDITEELTKINKTLNTKVDKVDGKQLSTNDYTNEDKEKLASLENYDDTSLRNELQQTETGVATANVEIEKLKSGKQDIITPGTGLAFDGNTLNVTLDTNVFFVAESIPASPTDEQKKKFCLIPADTTEEGNFYTEYVWVVDDEYPNGYWEEFGTYKSDVDLSIYQTKTDNNLQTTNKTIVGAINEINNKAPVYTTIPTLAADYTVPVNATSREYVYEISVGATVYNITGAEGIKWADGVAPVATANSTIVVSVMNNLAVWGTF